MRRLLLPLKIFIILVVMISAIRAKGQNVGDNRQRAVQLLHKNLPVTGLNQAAIDSYMVTDAYADRKSGNFLVYLQQTHQGIPVYNKISVFIFKNDTLIGKQRKGSSKACLFRQPHPGCTGGRNPFGAAFNPSTQIDPER